MRELLEENFANISSHREKMLHNDRGVFYQFISTYCIRSLERR